MISFKNRRYLMELNKENEKFFEEIEKSLIVIAIDDDEMKSLKDVKNFFFKFLLRLFLFK